MKTFDPKPGSPGARVEWGARSGVIWSGYPATSTRWVSPDDAPGTLVAVHLKTGREVATWSDRDMIRVCNRLMSARRTYATQDLIYQGQNPGNVIHHIDPDCPMGQPAEPTPSTFGRQPYELPWGRYEIIDALVGRAMRRIHLCECISG